MMAVLTAPLLKTEAPNKQQTRHENIRKEKRVGGIRHDK